jgi:predicted nucleic acid-binding protein
MRTNIEIDDALLAQGDGGHRPQDQAQGGRSGFAAAGATEAAGRLAKAVRPQGAKLALQAADHYRTLRRIGITVRKSIDLLIGTYCIATACDLLHCDRDFEPMSQHLGLRAL